MRETGANYGRLAPDQHLTIKDKPVSARVSGEQAEQNESRIAENCKGTGGRATMVFVSN